MRKSRHTDGASTTQGGEKCAIGILRAVVRGPTNVAPVAIADPVARDHHLELAARASSAPTAFRFAASNASCKRVVARSASQTGRTPAQPYCRSPR